MKKKFIAIALAALCLASCGAKEINVSDLAATLKNQLTFSEELTEVGEKVTEKRIGLDEADVVQCRHIRAFVGEADIPELNAVIRRFLRSR